jgi:enediyne biosynthesis protein E4
MLAGLAMWLAPPNPGAPPAIRFVGGSLPFTLDSSETPQRHAPETMAGGVAIFDFNNDGALDLFFANGADIGTLQKSSPKYHNRLFANDGRGHFTDVTEKAGLAGTGFDVGVAIGDFDNDGCKDIFVTGVRHVTLYRNNCDGTFSDVTGKAGIRNEPDPEYGPLWSVGAAWVDVNNDGLLDLFIVNYLSWDPATEPACNYLGKNEYCHPKFYKKLPDQLYLNQGGGKFKDVSAESGIRAHPGKGMGVGVADFDGDGSMDLFVANDKLYNSLFRNKGNGRFEEKAFEANVAARENGELISGMGVDFRDLDNDGHPDISVAALEDETFPLFRNTGKGDFVDATGPSRMGILSLAMAGYSPMIFDFDNDGWKDIFVSRGHVQSPQMAPQTIVDQHNTVFRNLGNGKFEALTAEAGFTGQPARRHRGSAGGDLNGDGRVDVVVTSLGAPAEIWMNESPAAHWLEISLRGRKSNRDGIGARLKVVSKSVTQYNHVTTAVGYASSSAGPAHFGLGADATADLIEIRWPSGIVQRLVKVTVDRILQVEEPER